MFIKLESNDNVVRVLVSDKYDTNLWHEVIKVEISDDASFPFIRMTNEIPDHIKRMIT